jgi:hypothetical protein
MKSFFVFNKTTRKWHLPFVAGLCVGIPMLLGWCFNNMEAGKLASLAGLSILYLQSDKLNERMILLTACCFGLMASFALGLFFSYSLVIAPIALGIFAFGIHYALHKLQLSKPPGNFFFIMLASTATCSPFELSAIPNKIGYVALGTMFTCAIGLIYSLLTLEKDTGTAASIHQKDIHTNIKESIIFGFFICISLAVAFALKFENPYWVPISCLAVMQGSSSKHTWKRGLQRIVGTLLGLGITWFIVAAAPTPLFIVISIILLQMIVEFFIVRNYAIAIIFITILTIFLAEPGGKIFLHKEQIFLARLLDILMGSMIGIVGGWILYHEKIHYYAELQIKKMKKTKGI